LYQAITLITLKTNIMITLTITVNGKKSGEKVFFILNVAKANFLNVIDMTWETVEDVLAGEAKGQYTITKSNQESVDRRRGKIQAISKRSVNTEKTLKAFCKKYSEANTDTEAQEVVRRYTEACEFVSEANKLGIDRIKALGYKKKAIQAELNFTDPCTKHSRELKLLNTLKLKAGQWYSGKVLKARIQKIYDQQGVKPKANIKHLSGIYDMKPKRRQVKGVRTEGIIITSIKQRVNN
jgi:hypothetical protein